ncbi:MAG: tRNA (cytidine/uridine-2'-O-)-methyltransferase TrmJ [Betaproteobacteria bacterium ADurb.Bin341]|nr:MAG: tRNA (cytidine/uridine-2'-O-)-methyltransferase TrmJ [Betaproteobacteria bacterium ADurb.Bin341]
MRETGLERISPETGEVEMMNPEDLLCRVRVVLSHPSHPGNIGAAARAMKVMGLSHLVLVNPQRFPDEEATARATGAADLLERAAVCSTLDEALAGTIHAVALTARRRDLGPPALWPREAAAGLLDQAAAGEVALVFGNETVGLSNEEVQRCQAAVSIPTDPDFSSLNLGSAVQVLCYEARLAAYAGQRLPSPRGATPNVSRPATHEEVEGFYGHLEEVMIATRFLDPAKPKRLLPKLRRLFGKARLEIDEVNILRGILAATQAPPRD